MKEFVEQFHLRWDLHTDNMLGNLRKLLETESFTDVTIAVQNGYSIQCHKWVLAGCSAYFDQLFQNNRSGHPIIILSDVESCSIQSILSYMYTGEVNVSHDQFAEVLRIASFLKVKGLCENMEEIDRSDTQPAVLIPRNVDVATGRNHDYGSVSSTVSNSVYFSVHSTERNVPSSWHQTHHQCILRSSYENIIENPLSKKKKMSKLISSLDASVSASDQDQAASLGVMNGYRNSQDQSSNSSIDKKLPDTEISKNIEYSDVVDEDEMKHASNRSNHNSSSSKSGMAECYKQYSRADVEAAMRAVSEQDMSTPQAARRFGVPSRTLYDKLRKAGILPTRAARPQSRRATSTTICPELIHESSRSSSSPVDEASPPYPSTHRSSYKDRLPDDNYPAMQGCS